MGTIRLVLALTVALAHFGIGKYPALDLEAMFAVRAFFVISGFYMAMVICERYAELGPSTFYASRFLKLLPIYWFVSVASVFVRDGVPWNTLNLNSVPTPLLISSLFSLTSLLGIDAFPFIAIDPSTGVLSFAPDRIDAQVPLTRFSPVPQSWSIGLELWFYLLAPFIVRRSIRLLIGILVASIVLRYAFFYFVFGTWEGGLPSLVSGGRWMLNRAVFPFELAFFILGVLSYRALVLLPRKLSRKMVRDTGLSLLALVALCRLVALGAEPNWIVTAVSFLGLAISLPFLFLASKDVAIDNAGGELSYPIYMAHVVIMQAGVSLVGLSWILSHPAVWMTSCVVVSLSVGILLDRLIARPVDFWRTRLVLVLGRPLRDHSCSRSSAV